MRIYTIGFTGKSAQEFFDQLRRTDARYLADVRFRNNSQLAGFTKRGDIGFFTQQLTNLTHIELFKLAPSEEIFKRYRQDGDWAVYEGKYLQLLDEGTVAEQIDQSLFTEGAVLLCSEPTPEHCHRRLAAEFLKDRLFPEADIVHL